jgi:hypothetical protein
MVAIVTLLAYAAHTKSPTQPERSEWDACERPLGAWNIIWLLRTVLMLFLAVWNWKLVRRVPEGCV